VVVREWEGFCVSFLKRDDVGKTLLRGESLGLSEEISIDVDADNAVGLCIPGEPAIQHARPTAYFQDDLVGPQHPSCALPR
jgi:hypothetical protein